MPAIKIVNKNTRHPKRKARLWECFGSIGVNPTNIKDGKGINYAIVQQEKVEVIIDLKSKQKFQDEGFEIHTPIEYNALRTVVVKNIDQMITDFTDQEVIDRIQNSNPWAKIESIYRLAQSGRLLKVRFATTEMANKAQKDGLIVLYQKASKAYRL